MDFFFNVLLIGRCKSDFDCLNLKENDVPKFFLKLVGVLCCNINQFLTCGQHFESNMLQNLHSSSL